MNWGCDTIGCMSQEHRNCARQVAYVDTTSSEAFLYITRLPNNKWEGSFHLDHSREYPSPDAARRHIRQVFEKVLKQLAYEHEGKPVR